MAKHIGGAMYQIPQTPPNIKPNTITVMYCRHNDWDVYRTEYHTIEHKCQLQAFTSKYMLDYETFYIIKQIKYKRVIVDLDERGKVLAITLSR